MDCVNGDRKQLRYTEYQQTVFFVQLLLMLVKTCNKRCRVVLTGVSRITKREIHLLNSNKPYGLTHELGSVPLLLAPGHPELPQTILRNTLRTNS